MPICARNLSTCSLVAPSPSAAPTGSPGSTRTSTNMRTDTKRMTISMLRRRRMNLMSKSLRLVGDEVRVRRVEAEPVEAIFVLRRAAVRGPRRQILPARLDVDVVVREDRRRLGRDLLHGIAIKRGL